MACSVINTRLQLQVIVLIKIYFYKSIEQRGGKLGENKSYFTEQMIRFIF